jgi:outer membrane protein assembly factor BamA
MMSSVKPGITSAVIDAKIFNIGIFNGYTEYRVIEKKHTAKVLYTSHIHQPFIINEKQYALSDDSITRIFKRDRERSLIDPGTGYNLERLKNERIRLDALLKNKGYFYFSPDFILFKADTSKINHTVKLKITLKDSIPEKALIVYRINRVVVDQDHTLNADSTATTKDTIRYNNLTLIGKNTGMDIRPKVIMRSVYLRKNEIYTRKNHNTTINRLMSMGNYKFIQVKFTDSDTTAPGFLDVTILMTPMPKYAFRAETELVTKSNNFTGPRVNISLLNRNTFRGAELLNLNLAGSFEAQLSGNKKNSFSYSWNPQAELYFPAFLVPFRLDSTSSIYLPKTRFLISYNYLKRVDYFDMKTFQFIYGYKWKQDIRKEHELNPVNISYTSLSNQTKAFNDLLSSNPYLNKSYEEKFLAGGSYSFTFNEQVIPGKKAQYYFHLTTEIGGNLFSLANRIAGRKITSENPVRIAGSVYSQYAKLSLDGRWFYNLNENEKLALRIFAGVATAYGNSSTLPYIKQYFSGGPNSVRAFQINSLGPGSYQQDTVNIGFLQLGGDMKLEMNAEYRFKIFRFLKGALFADAGNIWLIRPDPSIPGGSFKFNGFARDIAVGAGAGLRIDVSFFILRFDLAMPLRKPWLGENQRWVIRDINFGDPTWRRNNLVLNVAIGYPF